LRLIQAQGIAKQFTVCHIANLEIALYLLALTVKTSPATSALLKKLDWQQEWLISTMAAQLIDREKQSIN